MTNHTIQVDIELIVTQHVKRRQMDLSQFVKFA